MGVPIPDEELERTLKALVKHGGRRGPAASELRIPRNTLFTRVNILKERGYEVPEPPTGIKTYKTVPVEVPGAKPRIRVQAGKPGGTKLRVVAIGDAHDDPHLPKDRFRWIGSYIAERKPDVVVQIGDFFTLDSLNSHVPDDTFAGRLKGTFLDDIVSGNKALEALDEGLNGFNPKKHVTLGNHEERIWRAEDQAPHVAGMMVEEISSMLTLHGWTWSRFGAFEYFGGVGFTHVPLSEMGKPMGGKTSELRVSNELCHDLVFGHTHKRRSWRAAKLGPFQHVTVLNLGCALPYGHIESYARHHLTGWSWGLHEITIQGGHIQDEQFVSMLELEERYV